MSTNRAVRFTGIDFQNPFLLSSAPPTESESNILRAFEAGWGGVVTKTIGLHPVTNVVGAKAKFLRTSPELHRRLTIEAAEQGVSVNQWAIQKLSERGIGELAVARIARLWYADAEARNEFAALVAQGHAALQDSGASERYAAALRAVFESASLSATGEHLSAAHDDDIALRT